LLALTGTRSVAPPLLLALVVSRVAGAAPGVEATAAPASNSRPEPNAPPAQAGAPEGSPPNRALAVGAAIVPGFALHGAGHYALDEKRTARRLFVVEAVSVGLLAIGGATIFFTGNSRYLAAPAIVAAMTGGGLFASAYFADIYGAASRDGAAVSSRLRAPTAWETELGYRRVYDPQYEYRDFLVERVSSQLGAFRFSPSAWFSTRGDTARYRLEGEYRLVGATGTETPDDASFLDVTLAFVHQRHRPERFAKGNAELSLDGRYDLGRLGPTLRGAFIEAGLGYAVGRVDYDAVGVAVPSDYEHLLLARWAFGLVLRGMSAPGSEVLVYYDHRHDDYAAGLLSRGIGSGVFGHFGLEARWFFNDHVGVSADFQVGSSYLGGASVLFRPRGVPARASGGPTQAAREVPR
jgi:hypothetical protein